MVIWGLLTVSALSVWRVWPGAGGVGMRESGPEQSRFSEGEVDVALPSGA